MPYSPPSSAFTAVDVPHFSRPTPGNHSTRHTRTPSASMLNFSTERGPGAHKPLRGVPRRAKPSPAPVLIDTVKPTPDASTPRSMAAFAPSARGRGRAKFRVGDDDSSESTGNSPNASPSGEDGPTDDKSTPSPWVSTASSSQPSPSVIKPLSIDTSAAVVDRDEDEAEPGKAVPFPLLSPEPVSIGPPMRRAAVVPLGSLPHFTSLANGNVNDVDSLMAGLPLSETPPAPSPVPALLSPRLLPLGAQKSLHINGHGRSASMADARLDRSPRISPTASGATTPIIRKSNGQPLKPSLKSSLSSPNISAMNEPRRIAKSAPATPRVHFKELGLESVVLFDKGARPVAVSGEYTGADDTETETETENNRGFPFPPVSPPPTMVRLAPTTTKLAFQPPPHSHVHLQYLSLPPVRPPRLHGTILVRNVTFGKSIIVRYTTDNWETASEILATYSSSLPPGIVPGSLDTPWDKFTFTIKLDDIERSLPSRTLFLVVRYDAHGAGEWWDNNQGQNYRVEFERPESNGLGLEAQSTTGDQSSAPRSFNPFTYQSNTTPAPPPPMTKPRSYSTSVVAPPAPIKLSAPAPPSNGPHPHLLSLKLSNYVSPCSNIPRAPALGKPVEKKQDASPPSSPELVKRQLELPESDFGVDFHSQPRDTFSPNRAPLKMPATITPPDSAHNSPASSPPAKRKPLPPPSSLSQSNESGLLSPSSSPSTSILITSPPSPPQNDPVAAETESNDETSLPGTLLDQSYSELINRFCFHHSSPGGTPAGGAYGSGPVLSALGMTNGQLVSSPKSSPRGGSPAGSGANSPSTGSKNGTPRGSFVLGTPGAGPAFTKWTPPSGLAGL